jgi:hypothetical protein
MNSLKVEFPLFSIVHSGSELQVILVDFLLFFLAHTYELEVSLVLESGEDAGSIKAPLPRFRASAWFAMSEVRGR